MIMTFDFFLDILHLLFLEAIRAYCAYDMSFRKVQFHGGTC